MRCCRRLFYTLESIAVLFLPSCVRVPDLDPTTESVPIYQIVERVKCELVKAVSEPLADAKKNGSKSRYWFLPSWNAGVDLTLVVNNQAGVSPSVSFIEPLTLASLAGRVTNMSRSASLGVGAGATTQAIRTDEMSFGLSLQKVESELEKHPEPYHYCQFPFGIDLTSDDLGLKEWVASAFSPLDAPDFGYALLTEGAPMPAGPGGSGAQKAKMASVAGKFASVMETTGANQTEVGGRAWEDVKQIQNSTFSTGALDKSLSSLEQLNSELKNEGSKTNTELKSRMQLQNQPEQKAAQDQISPLVAQLLALGNKIKKTPPKTTPPKPPLPPISAISHQVQFIVTWNANANPSWTLVHFKGPAAGSTSFFSAQQINTHTLTITLGPSSGSTGPSLSPEAQDVRQGQRFNATIQQLAPQLNLQ